MRRERKTNAGSLPARFRRGLLGRLERLARSREGVGAVEFALVVPILLIIYLMAFELTIAISMSRKISRASSDVADLVTQQTTVNKTFLSTMTNVAQSILAPYSTTGLTLKLTGVTIDSSSNATVLWSWKSDGTVPYTAGSAVAVPATLQSANTFLVHSEVSIPYSLLLYLPGFTGSQSQSFNISRDYFYRQRVGSNITCSNC